MYCMSSSTASLSYFVIRVCVCVSPVRMLVVEATSLGQIHGPDEQQRSCGLVHHHDDEGVFCVEHLGLHHLLLLLLPVFLP